MGSPCTNVIYLLASPFDSAVDRIDILSQHFHQSLFSLYQSNTSLSGSLRVDDYALVLYMEGVETMLIDERASQHGNYPSETSGHALKEILKKVDITDALTDFPARRDAYAAIDHIERIEAMHITMGSIIVRVLNMPLVLGEATELVRCWTRVKLDHMDDFDEILVHRFFSEIWMLSCSLLEAPSFGLISTFVADGTPTASPQGIAWSRAAVELLDATWNAGEHDGVG